MHSKYTEPSNIRESEYTVDDFDYQLPASLIAQEPIDSAGYSRLLVVDRKAGTIRDLSFENFPDLIENHEAMVINKTKVFKARVRAAKTTGGKVELLFLKPILDSALMKWEVLCRPGLKEGQQISIPEADAVIECIERTADAKTIIQITKGSADEIIEKAGALPLPPYIKREARAEDEKFYQTIYADSPGAVAAPTAGLHFTQDIMDSIKRKGVSVCPLTLHVGYGTFQPVADIQNHIMHTESFDLSPEVASELNGVLDRKGGICAIGTTSVRVLETCILKKRIVPGAGETDLFVYPPFKFEAVSSLLTNFHLPKSTLLMLVSAFMGIDLMREAYDHAVKKKYRFFSYGDAMLIL